ncbi:MAG: AmmeMemoRadiSam system protein A [Candidatus Cloacimonadaceae bacterium]|jgi:AmmeMemoRadiSam system protein A|nr:AmmeMemoRadiSam system protein A [Candidatus Cloacimonadota bacterium]MDY0127922.1 AmmeMemoRadiSam system protein A [Candidatus Cloacimonadaceae bacterium]MCB5255287.1 AmmeMemoRadiSam system protein A [Candidatus Cloacimonadota bacterium]MCK9177997.1 AmmeMemoRadiSam system protein A [Candidatus Cloacimonadota bacterium]MCK9242937.1 AmmeMemoRadiSam system protein A [Candidatus Cloacimonadota bacterium]
MLNDIQKRSLLQLAYDVIYARLHRSKYHSPQDPLFEQKRGIFVTLHIDKALRGCIGYIVGYKSILESVKEMAIAAAFRDPRFPPLGPDELADLEIELSVLGELVLIQDFEEIEIGRDGLYIQHPYGSGLLLPQVATEWGWDRQTFLNQVCQKAGLPKSAAQDEDSKIYRFSAEIFSANAEELSAKQESP